MPETNPSRSKHRKGTVWQRRYWEQMIRDEQDFVKHVEDIYYNPVKHELANAPRIGPVRRFTATLKRDCIQRIGERR